MKCTKVGHYQMLLATPEETNFGTGLLPSVYCICSQRQCRPFRLEHKVCFPVKHNGTEINHTHFTCTAIAMSLLSLDALGIAYILYVTSWLNLFQPKTVNELLPWACQCHSVSLDMEFAAFQRITILFTFYSQRLKKERKR